MPAPRSLQHLASSPRRAWRSRAVLGLLAGLFALALGLAPVQAESPKATSDDIAEGKARYTALLETHGLDAKKRHAVRLDVYKADRRLELFVDEVLVASYRVGLGWNTTGDKLVEGDGRTPEGEYHVVTRHTSRFHLFLGLDYPNAEDVERALAEERIDAKTARSIQKKLDAGERPPWDTALGGAIGVHGGGGESDWTAGCIAVEDDEIELIYAAAKMGTTVRVFP